MIRTLAFMLSTMLLFAVVPASAQSDTAMASTPDASATAQSSPAATAQASPVVTEFEAGEWDYIDDDNTLTIELTSLKEDMDGQKIVDDFDPEDGTDDSGLTFSEELDAPGDCRMFEYETPDVPYFVALCTDNELGLWVFGTDGDAVTHVAEQFVDDNPEMVPDGYTEDD